MGTGMGDTKTLKRIIGMQRGAARAALPLPLYGGKSTTLAHLN